MRAAAMMLGAFVLATMMKAYGDIATKLSDEDPDLADYYQASTFGLDLLVGKRFGDWAPFLAAGITDVSTVFYVDDTGAMVNNTDRYRGPVVSAGVDSHVLERVQLGAEFYTAPGAIYTGRLRAGLRF